MTSPHSNPEADVLRQRLNESMRVAALRIVELERKCFAYERIIEDFDRRLRRLHGGVPRRVLQWQLIALATAAFALGTTLFLIT